MKYIFNFWGEIPQVEEDSDLEKWKEWFNQAWKKSGIGKEARETRMEEELRGFKIIKAD